MKPGSEWDFVKTSRPSRVTEAGFGMLRAALLFCSAGIALALIIVPMLDKSPRIQYAQAGFGSDLDFMSTGSVKRTDSYTLRRSVLQSSPNAVCVIRDGKRSGDC